MVVHAKERCTSCGVWKDKQNACYLCVKMPNRMQMATPEALRRRARLEAVTVDLSPGKEHVKERCKSCGVWKDKKYCCYQCTNLPNRLQVACSKPPTLASHTNHEALPPKQHTHERCKSCGVWKDKTRSCYQCTDLPDRVQVQATLRSPSQSR